MSQCEILKPYSFGAFKSGIIKRLREGHGNLTDAQIRTIACWIDLGVPCYADYEEGGEWSGNLRREYEEKTNKRAFYDMLDRGAKDALGGTALPGTLTVEYSGKDGSKSVSGEGTVILQTRREIPKR